jgi:1-phosphofructokinase
MIYTVTFNPSLDYTARIDALETGGVNRAAAERISVGGKGLNVSKTLSLLGFDVTAIAFVAGFTGREIKRRAEAAGFNRDFIELGNGISRINVKLISDGDTEPGSATEINGQGPVIEEEHIEVLAEKLAGIADGDALILAGSVPPSVSGGVYGRILESVKPKNPLAVVDAAGELLSNALGGRPFLVKPNLRELGDLFDGADIKEKADAAKYARLLQGFGARNVLVSMGSRGAVLLTEGGEIFHSAAAQGRAESAVGAGDAMTGGFIAGWLRTNDYAYALRLATAAGSASAFAKDGFTAADIEHVLSKTVVER